MVYIVIPAFNEAEHIGAVVAGCKQTCPEAGIVVVDDGSGDATAERARGAGADVLVHAVNRGQGAALRTGTMYALSQGAETIVHFDADGQNEPADIVRAVALAESGGHDIIFGSRFLNTGGSREMPACKRVLLYTVGRLVNYMLTGMWLSDAHNGFRVLSRRAALAVNSTQDRMAHNSDIVRQVRKHRLAYAEMPVTVHYREYGQRLSGGFKIVFDMILGRFL